LTIDRRQVTVEPGTTVLEAARRIGIQVPTLGCPKEINQTGACHTCLVEVRGACGLQTACTLPVAEGMEVQTNTPNVREARELVLELLLSGHSLPCPTGALTDCDDTRAVGAALADPSKHVVIQVTPATRVSIGELFGVEAGRVTAGQLVAGLRALGFDKVFDTSFAADVTVVELASELLSRMENGGALPLITACSPDWAKFAENLYPEMLANIFTGKSPQQVFGTLVKTYYAEKSGVDPADIVSVSVVPCTAKRHEAARPEMNASGHQDVDYVLTTRELGRMLQEQGISLAELAEESCDSPLGIASGAGTISGVTGGVMEAAMRTAAARLGTASVPRLKFSEVRGKVMGLRESVVVISGHIFRLAIANGLPAAAEALAKVRRGEAEYHFIEIMGCPGGCIGGGGLPCPAEGPEAQEQVRQARIKALYALDEASPIRRSHENPAVQALYTEWLGAPGGEKARHLLHTAHAVRTPVGAR
jgi:NADH-quinone oxidoreductase subunit G/NADP-reducing hydrogenase subunit HndD